MVNSQEIIERSLYSAILGVAIDLGYTVNPDDFLPVSQENSNRFKDTIKNLDPYIAIFGTGNNQSKGQKLPPG